jgi:hypothetical protein
MHCRVEGRWINVLLFIMNHAGDGGHGEEEGIREHAALFSGNLA